MSTEQPRPCERQCPRCEQWLHTSRFRSRQQGTHGSVCTTKFNRLCRACEQKERNERKNEDRPLAIMKHRAGAHATKYGASPRFFWVNMNYRALVPVLRAMLGPEGVCLSCGHKFVNERDIQIEHRFPPRHRQDWARLHARNLTLLCGSCNNGKHSIDPAIWLDDQEAARIANEPQSWQGTLWESQ